jgi:hypothetical protein
MIADRLTAMYWVGYVVGRDYFSLLRKFEVEGDLNIQDLSRFHALQRLVLRGLGNEQSFCYWAHEEVVEVARATSHSTQYLLPL